MRGRGGYVDGAVFEDIEIVDVSDQAIQINMFYEFSTIMPKMDTPSDFRNITIRNVKGNTAGTGIQIKGLPEHRLGKVELENIQLTAENAFLCSEVEEIYSKDVRIDKGNA